MPATHLYPLVMARLNGTADRMIEDGIEEMYPTVFDPRPRVVDLVATPDGCQSLRFGRSRSFSHVGLADPRAN